jgi:2-polyprenyl-3-methyl-5-hydroxy-6-metoxy-1,4-benzoquinol methylase
MKRFLNLGPSKDLPVPEYFKRWTQELATAEPDSGADHNIDPRELASLPAGQYDAVYCPHVLEHHYPHHVRKILAGMQHVLRPDGFTEIRTVNLAAVMKYAVEKNLDLSDPLYETDAGAVTLKEAIFGFEDDTETDASDSYAHRTGFTPKIMADTLTAAGFARVIIAGYGFNLLAYGFRAEPNVDQKAMLHLPS